ncbi:dystrophin, isoforms A/C/F/G/H-like [Drosophila bipectinata]|uniref:dystrophin, isoforms A/C/F/G/H-like n=1 Tax=Drosophila bipectinata TaxID=42026 RepID=UPI0038B356CE
MDSAPATGQNRTELLEPKATEAEQSEKCIVQFEAWLTRVDEVLSEYLEHDVTIEDLPEDFQRLAWEFVANEKIFKEIAEIIAKHTRREGRSHQSLTGTTQPNGK